MVGRVTGTDLFIASVVFVSTVFGLMRGFVREMVSLVGWIVGLWAAWKFGPRVEPHLGGLLAEPAVRPWIGRMIVLIGVLLIGMVMNQLIPRAGLGMLDRGIGVLFGFTRGMLLLGFMVICGELLHLNRETWWRRSTLIPYGETVGDWERAMVGERGDPWSTLERVTGVKVR